MSYYHCIKCTNIPFIEINDDKLLIQCKLHQKQEIKIKDFKKECQGKCYNCGNIPKFLINKSAFVCENCNKYIPNNKKYKLNINLLDNVYCSHHDSLFNYYCSDCNENKCDKCKYEDNKNHKYLPDMNKLEIIKKLTNFINSAENKIKEIKEKLEKMENELNLYKLLLYDKNSIITKEIIFNIENLYITKNIQDKEKIFIDKMNEIKKELENFKNFEYKNNNLLFNKNIVDIKKSNKQINKTSHSVNRYKMVNNINNNISSKNYDNKKSTITKMNNIDSINRNISDIEEKNKIVNKISNINNIFNNKSKEIDNIKIFQKPKYKLYQKYAIKLDNIINKNKYIIQKIEEISNNLEDGIDINQRNNFLFFVSYISREAHNYSNELAEILIQQFYKDYNNEINSINYYKVKTELSSWVNQSLIIDYSEDFEDLRNFYTYYCQKEQKRIQNYLKLDSSSNSILNDHNFDLQKLFRCLSQLYTEVLLFSDKNIYLKYVEKCDFEQNKMKDITDLNGRRFVIFTVLPGLFVNDFNINNCKILVFCDKKSEAKYNIHFENIKNNELYLKNTIKKINIEYNLDSKKIYIKIICEPKIPNIDNLKFSIKLFNSSKEIISDKNRTEFLLDKKYKNEIIFGTAEVNGEIIRSKEIKLEQK